MEITKNKRLELLSCAICGKKTALLINIATAGISIIRFRNAGICLNCLKNKKDIEDKLITKNIEFYEEQINESKKSFEYWKKELKELKDNLKQKVK